MHYNQSAIKPGSCASGAKKSNGGTSHLEIKNTFRNQNKSESSISESH